MRQGAGLPPNTQHSTSPNVPCGKPQVTCLCCSPAVSDPHPRLPCIVALVFPLALGLLLAVVGYRLLLRGSDIFSGEMSRGVHPGTMTGAHHQTGAMVAHHHVVPPWTAMVARRVALLGTSTVTAWTGTGTGRLLGTTTAGTVVGTGTGSVVVTGTGRSAHGTCHPAGTTSAGGMRTTGAAGRGMIGSTRQQHSSSLCTILFTCVALHMRVAACYLAGLVSVSKGIGVERFRAQSSQDCSQDCELVRHVVAKVQQVLDGRHVSCLSIMRHTCVGGSYSEWHLHFYPGLIRSADIQPTSAAWSSSCHGVQVAWQQFSTLQDVALQACVLVQALVHVQPSTELAPIAPCIDHGCSAVSRFSPIHDIRDLGSKRASQGKTAALEGCT